MKNCDCDYFKTLVGPDQQRYIQKLSDSDIYCPYCMVQGWDTDAVSLWPETTYFDIIQFLVERNSELTKEAVKAYKSLDSYTMFCNGLVREVSYNALGVKSYCVLKAFVGSSQRIHLKVPHEPWVCISKTSGDIKAAHCTCVAGLGEACSHIGALLFKIEKATTLGYTNVACTSKACLWNQFYRKSVEPEEAEDLLYDTSPHPTKKRKREPKKVNNEKASQPEVIELQQNLLQQKILELKKIAGEAVYFGGHEYSTTDTASEVGEDDNFPPVMLQHFPHLEDLSPAQQLIRAKNLLNNLCATKKQCQNLEEVTRQQCGCPLWFTYRCGRITGCTCHRVYTIKEGTKKDKLLHDLIYSKPGKLDKVLAIKWGRENECRAKIHYVEIMKKIHKNFTLRDAGFLICEKYPFIGVSPDGIRYCDCHGFGCLEVKCPFMYKDFDIHTDNTAYINNKTFCLSADGIVKKTHQYYTQMQLQMYVFDVTFCDFALWTTKGIKIQTVPRDDTFCMNLVSKLSSFAEQHLAVELVKRKLQEI